MKIMFADWTIAMAASNARQYDDNVWTLDLTGELPEGWTWAALIAQGENLDIIELTLNEAGASAALTAAQLSLDGYYTIQIRGTKGDQVRHTNLVQVFIPRSLSGDATWPTLPTEFSQAEARISAASAHPPIPGEDGYWKIWDTAAGAYKQSDTPVPGGDGGTDLSLGLTSAAVGQIAKITEVDAEGKPTKWEPVDLPSGEESGDLELIVDHTVTDEEAAAVRIVFTADKYPKLKNLTFFVVGLAHNGDPGGNPWLNVLCGTNNVCKASAGHAGMRCVAKEVLGRWHSNSGYVSNPVSLSVLAPGIMLQGTGAATIDIVSPLWEEFDKITLQSYTKFTNVGAKIKIWGMVKDENIN